MSGSIVEFDSLKSDISIFLSPVKTITVSDFKSAQSAIEAAKQVKGFIKRVETVQKLLVEPLNIQVKTINAFAKDIKQPLLDAESFIKARLVAFEIEQEKIRESEKKKLEESRKIAESELLAKQEAARLALLENIKEDKEVSDIFGAGPEAVPSEEKIAEFDQKAAEALLVTKGHFEAKNWEINQMGVKNSRKTWKCELTDIESVPKEYLIKQLNSQAVLAMARAGVTNIPGVRIWQETTVAIGDHTYIPRKALGMKSYEP